jgi:hypothetical protein
MSKLIARGHARLDASLVVISKVEGEKHNWRDGRDVHGPVRANQLWRKRDAGILMRTIARSKNQKWTVDFMKGGGKSSHTLKERDIWKFYDKVSK